MKLFLQKIVFRKHLKILIIFVILFYSKISYTQYYDFGFVRNDSIIVLKNSGIELKNAWLGGLNNCQFFEMDINLDGIKDLIVFDKHGNKIIPFLKINSPGNQHFKFSPQYEDLFPKFKHWVIGADFNRDNKNDLFTYTIAGIRVWKNISDTILKFELFKSRLNSNYGSGFVNLFVSEVDYPAIYDFDNDGDLDILNFSSLGMYLDYHQNLSFDDYANYDSLTYKINSRCWGKIEENEQSNILTLNSNCFGKCQNTNFKTERHAGSSLFATNLNNDNLPDLLIGDVDYPHLISLINGGTIDTAKIIFQDTLFPNPTKPIRLNSMPCANLIDIDFDNKLDLVISPFDPSRTTSENKNSIWLYKNIATNELPSFEFVKSNFLQDDMLDFGSGAYPVFFDYNNDQLMDILVGNWGSYDSSTYQGLDLVSYHSSSLALLKNIGTQTQPKFKLLTENLGNLKNYKFKGLYPAPIDIDNDGDLDLLIGNENGKLIYLENIDNTGEIPIFANPVLNYQNISVFSYSAPQIFDLDRDNKPDLLLGDSLGKIHYFKNIGTLANPQFSLITDTLGGVNVRNSQVSYYGYSTPCFVRHKDTTILFVGSESGFVYSYKNIDNNLSNKFNLIDDSTYFVRNNMPVPIYQGFRSAVAAADINNDGFLDIVLGNYSGGLTFFFGTDKPYIQTNTNQVEINKVRYSLFPNPSSEILNIYIDNENIKINKITILSINGKTIKEISSNFSKIDISTIKSGFYIIKIDEQNGNENFFKIIINH